MPTLKTAKNVLAGKSKTGLILALATVSLISAPSYASLLYVPNLVITGVAQEIIGTTASIPIGTSGTPNNTNIWDGTTGKPASASFLLKDLTTNFDYGMRVTPTNVSGVPSSNDNLMIARTVNSQGFADTGSLSIYIGAATTANPWTIDFKFEFFSGTNFLTPANLSVLLTSYDLDFGQKMGMKTSDTANTYLATNTFLTPSTSALGSGYTAFTASNTSASNTQAVNSSRNAFAALTNNTDNSFTVRMSHTAVALYMMEFRNPPLNTTLPGLPILPIPEPSGIALMGIALAAFSVVRRKKV